ncbi:MAG: polysaccharide pyruvyl transferase family protein, partial [archaeon]
MVEKIGMLHCENTLNYGSMMLGENVITHLSRLSNKDLNFIILSYKKEETQKRFIAATGLNTIKVRKFKNKGQNIFIKIITYFCDFFKGVFFPKKLDIFKKTEDCDIILIVGGDDLSEYYSIFGLLIQLRDIYALSKFKKVYLLGQTIGPFNSWRIPLVKFILGKIKIIYTRDQKSFYYLKNILKIKTKCKLSKDLAILDLAKQKESFDISKYNLKPSKYISFVPSGLWNQYSIDYNSYINGLSCLIKDLIKIAEKKGYKVLIFPHVYYKKDLKVVEDIIKKINSPSLILIKEKLLPYQARSILGSGYLTVTTRMHAAISSLQRGIPAIALSYSIKYKGVIGDGLDLPNLIIEVNKNNCKKDFMKVIHL